MSLHIEEQVDHLGENGELPLEPIVRFPSQPTRRNHGGATATRGAWLWARSHAAITAVPMLDAAGVLASAPRFVTTRSGRGWRWIRTKPLKSAGRLFDSLSKNSLGPASAGTLK